MELVSQDYVRVVARWIQVACAVWGSQATATVLLGGECCLGEELVELGYLDVLYWLFLGQGLGYCHCR